MTMPKSDQPMVTETMPVPSGPAVVEEGGQKDEKKKDKKDETKKPEEKLLHG